MTTDNSQPDLLSVLRRRREFARAMLELSRKQRELISQRQFSELVQLIAQKQQVLEHLTELGQAFGGIVAHWKSVRDQMDSALRAEHQQVIDETEALLAQIMEIEQQGTTELAQHRDETRKKLLNAEHLNETKSAMAGYEQTPSPRFLDVSR